MSAAIPVSAGHATGLALARGAKPIALELHALLKDLDPSRWRLEREQRARDRIARAAARLSGLLRDTADATPAQGLRVRLAELRALLREEVPAGGLDVAQRGSAWAGFRERLHRAYEALCLHLERHAIEVPAVRPTNYRRSLFHLAISVLAMVLIERVLDARLKGLVPLGFAVSFWLLEGLRRISQGANDFMLWLLRHIVHPHERFRYRVNSSTWYGTALAILGLFFSLPVCIAALAVLGVGDPVAALVGRKWGVTKLVGEKSLEGSVAFAVSGFMASLIALRLWHPELGMTESAVMSLGAALPAAVVELVSGRRIDDNFSIPVTAALGAAAVLLLAA